MITYYQCVYCHSKYPSEIQKCLGCGAYAIVKHEEGENAIVVPKSQPTSGSSYTREHWYGIGRKDFDSITLAQGDSLELTFDVKGDPSSLSLSSTKCLFTAKEPTTVYTPRRGSVENSEVAWKIGQFLRGILLR